MASNLGIRNNNWLNIRYNPANDWVGQTGSDGGGFVQFDDPVNGLRAADRLLSNYGKNYSIDTVTDTIQRFAPPEDNNPTPAYAAYVADKMGLSPDDKIDLSDPAVREQMLSAMVSFETPQAAELYSSAMMDQARGIGATAAGDAPPVAKRASSTPPTEARQQAKAPKIENGRLVREMPLTEVFSRSVQAGAEGLATDIDYFQALAQTLVGADEAAAENIFQARQNEEYTASLMEDIPSFEEFVEQPTFGGFITQAVKAGGQITPSALSSIAGAGIGGIAAVAGRGVLSATGRSAAKRVVSDSLKRVAKGVATPDESQLADEMYKYFRRGALSGAFASEYAPLSGSNLSEALDSGKELDPMQAFRAAALGAPQAAVGVLGEVALLKLVGNVASKRAAKDGGIFSRLASDIGGAAVKGGAIEGTTEFVQEGISVANRFDLDDTFTQEDAVLRLAESFFAGLIGGGAAGGAGGTLGAAAGESKRIFDKSKEQLRKAQEKRVSDEIDAEQFGETDTGVTTPEPTSDLNAQLDAIHDSNSTKSAVWIAGEQGREQFPEDGRYIINDKVFYARYIPGRGTIVTKSEKLADEVVKSGADEQSLAAALGYTSQKVDGADLVVEALDANGNVVSAELTNVTNLEAAQQNAAGLSPLGAAGVRVISADQALETRKRKLADEGTRAMEFDDEALEELGMTDQSQFENMDEEQRQRFEDNDQFNENRTTSESEIEVVAEHAPRDTSREPFDNEVELRRDFVEQFGEDARLDEYSGATMRTALKEQAANPNSVISIQEKNGVFQVIRESFDEMYTFEANGRQQRLPKDQYLLKAIGYAQGGKQKNRTAVLVRPDGSRTTIDLSRLINMGRGLLRTREGTEYVGGGGRLNTDRAAMLEILAELILYKDNAAFQASLADLLGDSVTTATGRFDIQDGDGVSLLDQRNFAPDGTFKGRNLQVRDHIGRINDLLGRGPRGSEVTASEVQETAERDTTDDDALPNDFGRGQTDTVSRDFDPEVDTQEAREESVINTVPAKVAPASERAGMESQEIGLQEPTRDEAFGGDPDRRRGAAPSTKASVEPSQPLRPTATWDSDPLVKGVHDQLLDTLELDERPSVVSFSIVDKMSDAEIRANFRPEIATDVIRLRNLLRERKTTMGFYSSDTNTIIIRETGNAMADALVIAHEIGHALFRQEQKKGMANPALRKRLEEAYKNSPKYKSYETLRPDQRGVPELLGFEEWYADQVARWATKQYINRQARSLTERHFKKLARRMKNLFNSITSPNFKRIFAEYDVVNETFEQYIEGVLGSAATHTEVTNTTTLQQTLIPDIVEQTQDLPGARSVARAYSKVTKSNLASAIRSLLLPADNILRKVAGDEIADMFYVRAQDLAARGKLGFLRATNVTIGRWKNRFEREIGDMSSPEVQDGFKAAFASTPTAELTGVPRQIRDYLEAFYEEYIEPSNTGIGKRLDYFPISLNLFEITERRVEFKQLLLDNDPTIDAKTVDAAIDRLVKLGQSIEEEPAIDPTNPAAAVEQAIKLTANIKDRAILGDFVNAPDAAFIDYMRHVIKRVEFNKATGGPEALQARLAALSDEDRKTAEDVISSYLGYQKQPIAPWMRKLNSWGQFLQFVTILPFATIASLPDLAGPIINHKDFSGLWVGFKQIVATVKDRDEAQQLARDIGVVTSETVANAWVTQAEQDYMDPMVRKLSDGFFRLIGLDFFTKFSREFASNMGVQFLMNHARNEFNNPNSTRYLEELGVTAEEIMAWHEGGKSFDTAEGAKVRDALARFVESSIMRPNAAERPVWASDPRFALVWQLKAYFYSYYKTIMGGVLREANARTDDTTGMAQLTAVSSILLLTAVATMPLAMMGMELREHAKNGLAWLLPGKEADDKYFRSDKMDWDDYWYEIVDKSGFLGPMSMARMAHQNAEWGNSAIFSLLGPTAETIEEAFQNGWRVDRTFNNRLAPIYNQL